MRARRSVEEVFLRSIQGTSIKKYTRYDIQFLAFISLFQLWDTYKVNRKTGFHNHCPILFLSIFTIFQSILILRAKLSSFLEGKGICRLITIISLRLTRFSFAFLKRVCDTCQEDFCYGRCEAFQYQDSQVHQMIINHCLTENTRISTMCVMFCTLVEYMIAAVVKNLNFHKRHESKENDILLQRQISSSSSDEVILDTPK